MKKITALVFIALAVVAACGRGADTDGLALLRAQVPDIVSGDMYLSVDTDGSCATDCPPASISRGSVVECADLSAEQDDYEQRLIAVGFSSKAADTWTKDSDDRALVVTLLTYQDAASGPQPTEQPYVDSPGNLSGACSMVVLAVIESRTLAGPRWRLALNPEKMSLNLVPTRSSLFNISFAFSGWPPQDRTLLGRSPPVPTTPCAVVDSTTHQWT